MRSERGALSRWLVGHLPVTMTIAATDGVMVSMVEHASRGHTPAPTAMVLSLSVAVGVLALVLVATSLADWRDLAPVFRPVSVALGVAAVVALLLGWLAPPPWLQILLLTLVLGAVWLYGSLTWFSFTHHDGASPADPRRRSARRPWWSPRRRPPTDHLQIRRDQHAGLEEGEADLLRVEGRHPAQMVGRPRPASRHGRRHERYPCGTSGIGMMSGSFHRLDSGTLTDASNGSSRTHMTKSWLCRLPIRLRRATAAPMAKCR